MKQKLRRFASPLIVLTGLFFVLPPLIHAGGYSFGILMVPLLLLMYPAASFVLCAFDGWRYGFSWILPLLAAALFLATVYIYYNSTALFYVVIYGSLGYIGELCGYVTYRNRTEQKER
ncbi:MAG: hypothetical protein HDQ87_09050 [Clostridia bacterium]|nr:hypothetical protein [Clostridia bacterium]